jgi:hypothetical protein
VIYSVDDKLPLGTTIFPWPPVYRGRIIYYPGGGEKRRARVDDLLQRFEEVGTGRDRAESWQRAYIKAITRLS